MKLYCSLATPMASAMHSTLWNDLMIKKKQISIYHSLFHVPGVDDAETFLMELSGFLREYGQCLPSTTVSDLNCNLRKVAY